LDNFMAEELLVEMIVRITMDDFIFHGQTLKIILIQPEGDETNWEWKIARIIYKSKFKTDK